MGQVSGIANEDARLFACCLGGGDNEVQAFCKIAGSRSAAVAEFVLKIRRADKKHIHTLDLRDLGGMVDSFDGLDLGHDHRRGRLLRRTQAVVMCAHCAREATASAR